MNRPPARSHRHRGLYSRPITLAFSLRSVVLPTLLASTALLPAPGFAQSATDARLYDIAPGPLDAVLARFGAAAGVPIALDPAATAERHSDGLRGRYTVEQGLRALLHDQPLEAVANPGGGYWLRAADMPALATSPQLAISLEQVTVTANSDTGELDNYHAATVDLGAMGQRALIEAPFSVDVVTRDLLDNQQSASLVDALKNDASVTPLSNNIGGLSSQIAIRGVGLDLLTGRKIDGLNIFGWSSDLPVEHFDQIQVLKGASGFLYGFAQPGGVVNFITKRPPDAPTRSALASITDSGTALITTDLGDRFGPDGRFGYRVNVVKEGGDSYVRDGGRISRKSGSLALDWRILPGLTWGADVLAINRSVTGSSSWGIFPNATGSETDYTVATPPSPVSGSERIFSPFTRYETRAVAYGTYVNWDFANGWRASVRYRGSGMKRVYRNGSLFVNATGDYTEVQYGGTDQFDTDDMQALVTGTVLTRSIQHRISFGTSYGRVRTYFSSVTNDAVLGTGNLTNRGSFADPHLTAPPADTLGSYTTQQAVFLSDTLRIGEHVNVVLGLRRNSLRESVNGYDRSATTPTAAVMFSPAQGVSIYTSYVEALEQGAVAPLTAANAQQVFAPLKTKQVEAGIKADRPQWFASASVFRIQRGLTYIDAQNIFTQNGEARYNGIELLTKARLTRRWQVIGSVMLLDARNVTNSEELAGKRVDGTPRFQGKLYSEYRLADTGFTLTGGLQYYGARPIDAANTATLPSYTLFDAGLRHETRRNGMRVVVRFNIDNLTNKAYWLTSASYLTQGAPRTFKLSTAFDF